MAGNPKLWNGGKVEKSLPHYALRPLPPPQHLTSLQRAAMDAPSVQVVEQNVETPAVEPVVQNAPAQATTPATGEAVATDASAEVPAETPAEVEKPVAPVAVATGTEAPSTEAPAKESVAAEHVAEKPAGACSICHPCLNATVRLCTYRSLRETLLRLLRSRRGRRGCPSLDRHRNSA